MLDVLAEKAGTIVVEWLREARALLSCVSLFLDERCCRSRTYAGLWIGNLLTK